MVFKKKRNLRPKKKKLQSLENIHFGTSQPKRPRTSSSSVHTLRIKEDVYKHTGSRKTGHPRESLVDQVKPSTRTGETEAEYTRRKKRTKHFSRIEKGRQLQPHMLVLGIAILVLILSLAIGIFAFRASINNKLQLSDDSTYASLAQVLDDGISYTLILGEYYEQGTEYTGPDLLILMRYDPSSKNISFLALPSTLRVELDSGESLRLKELQLDGGDASLINKVTDLVGVPIHHIVKIDDEGLVNFVDDLGGLIISVSEDIDDPQAGPVFIAEGTQLLDGTSALVFSRATNFKLGEKTTMTNQTLLYAELVAKYTDKRFIDLYRTTEHLSNYLESDCSLSDILRFAKQVHGAEEWNVLSYSFAGSSLVDEETGISYFYTDRTQWPLIQEAFKLGVEEEYVVPTIPEIIPSEYTLTIRNGSEITGVATQLASTLEAEGYNIQETGNADQFVYDETLVIYEDSSMADAATAIVDFLGTGRAIPSNGFYSFSSDILIVIGKDWKPAV